MTPILVDAGPLVALLHRDDQYHQQCVETLRTLKEPLVSVWPAFTEAMYLVNFSWQAQDALWEMVIENVLTLLPVETTDHPRMRELMKKYHSLPMDLADAALVRVAEREGIKKIFTVDRKDFSIYRPAKLGKFQIIP